MKILAAVVMMALSGLAFGAQDNIVTWDPPMAVDLPNITETQVEVKLEACTVVPDVAAWVQLPPVPVGTYTLTESNQPPGDYCYRAFFYNPDTGRSGVSNLAFKHVPFAQILNPPFLHPIPQSP